MILQNTQFIQVLNSKLTYLQIFLKERKVLVKVFGGDKIPKSHSNKKKRFEHSPKIQAFLPFHNRMIDKHALVHENSAVLHKTAIQRAQIGFTNQKSLRSPFEPIVCVNTPQSVSFSLVCEHYYWIHSGTVSQANTGHVQQDPSQVFLGFELLD